MNVLFEFPVVPIFRTNAYAPGLFDSFFGGFFFAIGGPMALQSLLLFVFPLAVCFALIAQITGEKKYSWASEALSYCVFILICSFLIQPWDELFVNLRHSLHLKDVGRFSFNEKTAIEGTVDFLPYFTIGYLGKLGFPLIELAFLQSIVGGVVCVLAARAFLRKINIPTVWSTLFFCIYPPLLFNAANGFTLSLFSAAILWGIYFLFFSNFRWAGISFFSLVPLIRFEGIGLVFLVFFLFCATCKPSIKTAFVILLSWVLPFTFLSWWRYEQFGSIIPLPVQFKAAYGGWFYFFVGLRNLLADLVTGFGLAAAIAIFCWYAIRKELNHDSKLKILLVGTLFIFIIPYYTSGGDWLPRYWGRYLLPFSLFSIITACSVCFSNPILEAPKIRWLVLVILISQGPWFFSSYRRMAELVFVHKKAMANIWSQTSGAPSYHRIHHLSQLGLHLGKYSQPDAVIGSSEVATIMYFARREALDFLGIANPEIVKHPVRLPPKLIRQWEPFSELPYLIFRRLGPRLLEKKPEYIYTFDFFMSDLMPEIPPQEITDDDIRIGLRRWEYKFRGLLGPLYGGVSKLMEQGYRPVVVVYANHFSSLYFVSSIALPDHFRKLDAGGFKTQGRR